MIRATLRGAGVSGGTMSVTDRVQPAGCESSNRNPRPVGLITREDMGSCCHDQDHLRKPAMARTPQSCNAEPVYDYDLLVLGSGPSGQKAAIAASKLGKRVGIVDRRDMIGGVCINTGTVPSK